MGTFFWFCLTFLFLVTTFWFSFGETFLSALLEKHENSGDLIIPFYFPYPKQPLGHSNEVMFRYEQSE